MKKSTNIAAARKPAVRALVLALSCIGLASLPLTEVMANPQGGQVVAGSAAIRQETPNKIGITQTTDKAIIDWRSFSIGAKEQVQFYQPSASSVTLNRVVGQDPSQILGRLTANGQVFLVNPNGIYFGKNAQIDVAGLVASTHNIRNEDFLAGKYNFNIPGKPGAAVINEGIIHIADTGIAAFVAPSVANRGVIVAKLGKVALASANGFTLDFAGDQLLTFLVGDEVAKTAFDIEGKQLTSFVDNSGRIEAQGGYVLLTAKAAENAIHNVINQSGVIEATTVGTHNGEIILNAGKGSLSVSGTLDASAPNGGDGGFIETSGAHVAIDPNTKITTAAAIGKTGVWLIDPVNFTIAATGGDMTGAALATALGLNSVVIQSISGATGTTGDINVNDSVNWSAHKLTLNAQNNININANLNGTGTASLALEYGQGSVAAGNLSDYFVNAVVNLPAGQNFSTKQGSTGSVKNYTVITSLGAAGSITATDLQGMNGNVATGNYALGADIDAAATKNWGTGSGFSPVGSPILAFAGRFDGLGHTISNLTINRPATADVGLFGIMGEGSAIQNVGIVGGSVSGSSVVGGLVGACYYCNIHNSYATDNVTASSNGGVGGLVGNNTGGTISNSYATGNVGGVGSWADAGGLVGKSSWGTISNSYAMGDVSGPNGGVGGLVGVNRSAIINSYATGNVSGNSYYVGGLIGWNNSTVTNSYATGNVSGTGNLVGGLVGYTSGYGSGYNDGGTGTIINSYWNTQTSGQATSSGGGTGKTTAQMQQQASFSGWDFVNTWEILPGATRPTLKVLNAQAVSPVPPVVPPPSNLTPAQTLLIQQHQNDNPAMLLNAIGDGLFANSTSDPVWTGMYQNGSATPSQITANSLWPTYDKYRTATASKVLEGLVNGDIVYGSTIWTALGSPSSGNMNNRNAAYYTYTHPAPTSNLTVAQQALVDAHKNDSTFQLLLAIADGLFTNSAQDPVWAALYQNGAATATQVEANRLRRIYDAYTSADIFSLIRSGQLKNDSADNEWHSIYRNGSATAAQIAANGFFTTYDKYKGTTANTLFNGIIAGEISPNSAATNAVVWQALVQQNLSGTNKAANMAGIYNNYKIASVQTLLEGLQNTTLVESDTVWNALLTVNMANMNSALSQYKTGVVPPVYQYKLLIEKYKNANINTLFQGMLDGDFGVILASNNYQDLNNNPVWIALHISNGQLTPVQKNALSAYIIYQSFWNGFSPSASELGKRLYDVPSLENELAWTVFVKDQPVAADAALRVRDGFVSARTAADALAAAQARVDAANNSNSRYVPDNAVLTGTAVVPTTWQALPAVTTAKMNRGIGEIAQFMRKEPTEISNIIYNARNSVNAIDAIPSAFSNMPDFKIGSTLTLKEYLINRASTELLLRSADSIQSIPFYELPDFGKSEAGGVNWQSTKYSIEKSKQSADLVLLQTGKTRGEKLSDAIKDTGVFAADSIVSGIAVAKWVVPAGRAMDLMLDKMGEGNAAIFGTKLITQLGKERVQKSIAGIAGGVVKIAKEFATNGLDYKSAGTWSEYISGFTDIVTGIAPIAAAAKQNVGAIAGPLADTLKAYDASKKVLDLLEAQKAVLALPDGVLLPKEKAALLSYMEKQSQLAIADAMISATKVIGTAMALTTANETIKKIGDAAADMKDALGAVLDSDTLNDVRRFENANAWSKNVVQPLKDTVLNGSEAMRGYLIELGNVSSNGDATSLSRVQFQLLQSSEASIGQLTGSNSTIPSQTGNVLPLETNIIFR